MCIRDRSARARPCARVRKRRVRVARFACAWRGEVRVRELAAVCTWRGQCARAQVKSVCGTWCVARGVGARVLLLSS
eukprot:540121-Rhodomonas_salina.1